MPNVTKNYQVTIPREMREDLKIQQGDEVVFVKNRKGNWVIMKVEELTDKMIKTSSDIDESIEELKKGFEKGTKKNLESLGD